MPGGVFFDGQTIRRAGVLAKRKSSANQGRALTLNNLEIVAELPFLEKGKVVEASSRRALEALADNPTLLNIANFCYRPSRDSRVGGGPSKVFLVSPMATTQAKVTLLDAAGHPSLVLKARQWGPAGNAIQVAVADHASPDDGYRDLTLTMGDNVEPYKRLGSGSALAVWFTGTADPDAMALTAKPIADGSQGFYVAWSKNAVTGAGWVPAGRMLADGVLTLTPSGAGDHAATVSGINKATGVADTELVEWTASAAPTATTKAWSEISGIAWTPAAAETLGVDGNAFFLCPANGQVTLSDAATRINQFAADGYHAALKIGRRIEIVEIDEGALGDVVVAESLAPAITANALFTREALAGSALVTVEDGGIQRGRLVAVTANLVGGSSALEGAATTADWRASIAALRSKDGHTLVPLSTDAAVHDEAREHARYMRAKGGHEIDVIVGAAANETLEQLAARRQALADHDVAIVFQQPERADYIGVTRIFGPEWAALEAAAAINAINPYEPLTWKRAGSDAYHHATFDPAADGEAFTENALNYVFADNQNALKWERFVSTHAENDDPGMTEFSANRGVNTMLLYLRAGFDGFVANGDVTRASIVQQLKTLLAEVVELRYVESADQDSVDAEEAGSYIVLDWDYLANIPKNQIVLRPRQTRRRLTVAI